MEPPLAECQVPFNSSLINVCIFGIGSYFSLGLVSSKGQWMVYNGWDTKGCTTPDIYATVFFSLLALHGEINRSQSRIDLLIPCLAVTMILQCSLIFESQKHFVALCFRLFL